MKCVSRTALLMEKHTQSGTNRTRSVLEYVGHSNKIASVTRQSRYNKLYLFDVPKYWTFTLLRIEAMFFNRHHQFQNENQ